MSLPASVPASLDKIAARIAIATGMSLYETRHILVRALTPTAEAFAAAVDAFALPPPPGYVGPRRAARRRHRRARKRRR